MNKEEIYEVLSSMSMGSAFKMMEAAEKIVESTANKAAEEGGLTEIPTWQDRAQELGFSGRPEGYPDTDEQEELKAAEIADLRAAIAADRASRQVANKAEVDLILQARSPEGGPWQEVSGEDFFKAHANGYEVSICVNAPGKNSIRLEVTPPATTGASTADLEAQLAECMKATHKWASYAGDADGRALKAEEEVLSLHRQLAAEKLRADQGWQRAEAKSRECLDLRERMAGSVGASTVLTDERIENLWHEACLSHLDLDDSAIPEFARSIERETLIVMLMANDSKIDPVAAQAGQVAVPGWQLVPVEPTETMVHAAEDLPEGTP